MIYLPCAWLSGDNMMASDFFFFFFFVNGDISWMNVFSFTSLFCKKEVHDSIILLPRSRWLFQKVDSI